MKKIIDQETIQEIADYILNSQTGNNTVSRPYSILQRLSTLQDYKEDKKESN